MTGLGTWLLGLLAGVDVDALESAVAESQREAASARADRDLLQGQLRRKNADLATVTDQRDRAQAELATVTGQRDRALAELRAANQTLPPTPRTRRKRAP